MNYAKPDVLAEMTPAAIRAAHPDVSFPPTILPHHVADLGYLPIEADPEPELQPGEEMHPGALRLEAGRILRAWVVMPAPAHAPQSVSMRQARHAMLNAGILDAVETMIAQMPGDEGAAARIDWQFAQEVRRDWPLVVQLGPQLGLTTQQIDDLFRYAATIPQ